MLLYKKWWNTSQSFCSMYVLQLEKAKLSGILKNTIPLLGWQWGFVYIDLPFSLCRAVWFYVITLQGKPEPWKGAERRQREGDFIIMIKKIRCWCISGCCNLSMGERGIPYTKLSIDGDHQNVLWRRRWLKFNHCIKS